MCLSCGDIVRMGRFGWIALTFDEAGEFLGIHEGAARTDSRPVRLLSVHPLEIEFRWEHRDKPEREVGTRISSDQWLERWRHIDELLRQRSETNKVTSD